MDPRNWKGVREERLLDGVELQQLNTFPNHEGGHASDSSTTIHNYCVDVLNMALASTTKPCGWPCGGYPLLIGAPFVDSCGLLRMYVSRYFDTVEIIHRITG